MIKIITLLCKRIVNFIREKKEMRGIEFVRLKHGNGDFYKYVNSNSVELGIFVFFLSSDCTNSSLASFKEALMDKTWPGGSGNLTLIDHEDGYIYLSDMYPDEDEEYHIEIKMTVEQFIEAIDIWQNILNLEQKPKEIIIKRKDDEFIFETYD